MSTNIHAILFFVAYIVASRSTSLWTPEPIQTEPIQETLQQLYVLFYAAVVSDAPSPPSRQVKIWEGTLEWSEKRMGEANKQVHSIPCQLSCSANANGEPEV